MSNQESSTRRQKRPDRENPGSNDNPAGSPKSGEPVFLVVGKLRRPHGIKGEMLMDILTDFPERLEPGATLYLGPNHKPVIIRSTRPGGNELLIGFKDYNTPEIVSDMRNQLLYVTAADRPPLPEGEYYHHQLIGLCVVDETGTELGKIVQILDTSANDVYVVRSETSADILLPATEEVILDVDLDQGLVHVHLLPGLLED